MNQIQDVINAACKKLELTVQDMGATLQLELGSIPLLEEVILAIKQIGDESALNGACFMAGAYLGEILRKEIGGDWVASADGGLPSIWANEKKIFPIEKAKEFARTPDEEGLVFYANVLISMK